MCLFASLPEEMVSSQCLSDHLDFPFLTFNSTGIFSPTKIGIILEDFNFSSLSLTGPRLIFVSHLQASRKECFNCDTESCFAASQEKVCD